MVSLGPSSSSAIILAQSSILVKARVRSPPVGVGVLGRQLAGRGHESLGGRGLVPRLQVLDEVGGHLDGLVVVLGLFNCLLQNVGVLVGRSPSLALSRGPW